MYITLFPLIVVRWEKIDIPKYAYTAIGEMAISKCNKIAAFCYQCTHRYAVIHGFEYF